MVCVGTQGEVVLTNDLQGFLISNRPISVHDSSFSAKKRHLFPHKNLIVAPHTDFPDNKCCILSLPAPPFHTCHMEEGPSLETAVLFSFLSLHLWHACTSYGTAWPNSQKQSLETPPPQSSSEADGRHCSNMWMVGVVTDGGL